MHQNGFGIKVQWNFFVTTNGKSPCDGIRCKLKRATAKASKTSTFSDFRALVNV